MRSSISSCAPPTIRARCALLAFLATGLAACGGGGGSSDPAEPPAQGPAAFVTTSDAPTGSFAVFPLADPDSIQTDLGQLHSDATAREWGGLIYVVNRLGADNIQAIDPADGFQTLWQCSVGNGSNPHDIAFAAADKAYVTLFGETSLRIVDPSVGESCDGFLRGEIDLSVFADADGIPEMDRMALVGNRLYVSIGRLDRDDRFAPTDHSLVAVVDTETDTLVDVDPSTAETDAIVLTGTNPFSDLIVDENAGTILLVEVGGFGEIGDGGIDVIDLATQRALGYVVTEEDLGGNITDVAFAGGGRGYAIVLDAQFNNLLVQFDMAAPQEITSLFASDSFLPDLEYDSVQDQLYLVDRSVLQPGIHIFRGSDGAELTPEPVSTGLPPTGILLFDL